MKIKSIIKTVIAAILYSAGILFAIYVSMKILGGKTMFNLSGLIICSLGVCIPTGIASFLLISNTDREKKKYLIMKIFIIITAGFYSMLLASLLFLTSSRGYSVYNAYNHMPEFNLRTNLVPFRTIGAYIRDYNNHTLPKSIIFQNLIGNFAVFAPCGILLPCIFKRLENFWPFFLVMLVILLGVEIGQFITGYGSMDIDDVILNMTGAVLFYGVCRLSYIQKLLKKIHAIA